MSTGSEAGGDRLYYLLAMMDDRKQGHFVSNLVRAAREGWERSHPDEGEAEEGAWAEFDALWARRNEH